MNNSNPAVRALRVEPRQSLDDFPTPCWGTRALVEEVLAKTDIGLPESAVWEPASNRGYMSRVLKEYWRDVATSDVFDYRADPETVDPQDFVADFIAPIADTPAAIAGIIISNPPFVAAQEFIQRALSLPNWRVVAMLTRTNKRRLSNPTQTAQRSARNHHNSRTSSRDQHHDHTTNRLQQRTA